MQWFGGLCAADFCENGSCPVLYGGCIIELFGNQSPARERKFCMNPAENYTYRYLETDDLDQYNALLRYTFQVTEDELTATGWKDDEI